MESRTWVFQMGASRWMIRGDESVARSVAADLAMKYGEVISVSRTEVAFAFDCSAGVDSCPKEYGADEVVVTGVSVSVIKKDCT